MLTGKMVRVRHAKNLLIPQYVIFQRMGMVNTFWPLVLPKFLATDAFFVFLMVQFIRGLPRELDEAATIDGCGPVQTFRFVTLPYLRPAIGVCVLFRVIASCPAGFAARK